jgi:hypothetical protein
MRGAHEREPLGRLAAELIEEIGADRAVVDQIAERVGDGGSALKEATAWVAEKFSRLKLKQGDDTELGVFEALEALALGILGKLKLWLVLAELAQTDERLRDLDYDNLIRRARSQHDRVEAFRIKAARAALAAD